MVDNQETILTGRHGEYSWIWIFNGRLHDALSASPDLVVGRYVAVAAIDSSPMKPTAEEFAGGWKILDGTAWSPQVERASELPAEEFDEWWVFTERGGVAVPRECFVNDLGFTPDEEQRIPKFPEGSGWDIVAETKERESRLLSTALFWSRVEEVRPFAVLIEGQALTIVCRDARLLDPVRSRCE